jgi:Ca2+-binding RTX toxin-like protein
MLRRMKFAVPATGVLLALAPGVVGSAQAADPTCFGQTVTVNLALGQTPTNGDDVIYGTAGPDIIDALEGNDYVCSLSGDDIVRGGGGVDNLFGGTGADQIGGGAGEDNLVGGDDPDLLQGAANNDTARGGRGDDMVTGGKGDDDLGGGAGNDKVAGNEGTDTCNGSAGFDQVVTCEVTIAFERGEIVAPMTLMALNELSSNPVNYIDGDAVAPEPNPALEYATSDGGDEAATLEQRIAEGDAVPGDQESNG